MDIKDHVLKLSGKASLLSPVELGYNYHVEVDGSVTSKIDTDQHDGSIIRYYKFEPVLIKLINEMGETIKAKDTRSQSQKIRSLLKFRWEQAPVNVEFEDYYIRFTNYIIRNIDQIAAAAMRGQ